MGILEFSRESERMAEIGILKIHIENNEIEDSPLQGFTLSIVGAGGFTLSI